jgi:hypothetical protein
MKGKAMINQTLSNEFILFFRKYLAFYEQFLHIETEKFNKLVSGEFESIDDQVKQEEVFMLKARGLEKEREKLMMDINCPKSTFKEVISQLDPSVQDEASTIYSILSQTLQNLKHSNLKSNYLIKLKLHRIEVNLEKLKSRPDLQKQYNAQAVENTAHKSILSKKV